MKTHSRGARIFWAIPLLLWSVCTFASSVSPEALREALTEALTSRAERVQEFVEIRKLAEERGLRVWLFGGTAAAYAHYVKWDLLREAGDHRFQGSRFDYDFTNIYRSTQDADIVVDGTAEQVHEFQEALQRRFPYLMGSKSQWEVRSLRFATQRNEALLNNPDFLNQHTDSNSTGMIELTETPESRVRDLRDWMSPEPQFLIDVAEGKLHYYFSEKHHTTPRFRNGKNPPIISVVRFFTKAFQFELAIREEDLARLRTLIDEFNPSQLSKGSYLEHWLEKNGHKLFTHAVDVEYAWRTLDEVGLRTKLISASKPQQIGTLGWWLNKEPLRTYPVGRGHGKTIADLAHEKGIPLDQFVVAHETSDFLAYESLSRNTKGTPNVFISRSGVPGEAAAFGDGHYTMIGTRGARGTGLTIRYRPNPNAREGTDFIRADAGDMLVWRNRAALEVIWESVELDIFEYFQMLANNRLFDHSDRGIQEKLRRKMTLRLRALSAEDERRLYDIAKDIVSRPEVNQAFLSEWLALPIARNYPDIVERVLDNRNLTNILIDRVFTDPKWSYPPYWLDRVIEREIEQYFAVRDTNRNMAFRRPPWWRFFSRHKINKAIDFEIQNNATQKIIEDILSRPEAASHPYRIEMFLKHEAFHYSIARHVLSQPAWGARTDWFNRILSAANDIRQRALAQYVLSQPHWSTQAHVVDILLEQSHAAESIAMHIVPQPHLADRAEKWITKLFSLIGARTYTSNLEMILAKYALTMPLAANHPEWFKTLAANPENAIALIQYTLPSKVWAEHPEFVKSMMEHTRYAREIAKYVLSQPHWSDHPELVEHMLDKIPNSAQFISDYVLSQPGWEKHPHLLERLIRENPRMTWSIGRRVLSQPHWRAHPELLQLLTEAAIKSHDAHLIARFVLSSDVWVEHPEFIERLIRSGAPNVSHDIDTRILNEPYWRDHPELRRVTGGESPTYKTLKAAFDRGEHVKGYLSIFGQCESLLTAP